MEKLRKGGVQHSANFFDHGPLLCRESPATHIPKNIFWGSKGRWEGIMEGKRGRVFRNNQDTWTKPQGDGIRGGRWGWLRWAGMLGEERQTTVLNNNKIIKNNNNKKGKKHKKMSASG